MDIQIKPIYLFADSQLLFWRSNDKPFLQSLWQYLANDRPGAAYLGASNNNRLEFYEIFTAAMAEIGIKNCKMIPSIEDEENKLFLAQADIILLAGGDVARGWRFFQRSGIEQIIRHRYLQGAVLIGISAGAIQLGMSGWYEAGKTPGNLFRVLELVPYIIGVHAEKNNWQTLRQIRRSCNPPMKAIGIPSGGGMIYHPDQRIEPVRQTLYKLM